MFDSSIRGGTGIPSSMQALKKIKKIGLNIKKIKNNTVFKPTHEINDLIELKNFL